MPRRASALPAVLFYSLLTLTAFIIPSVLSLEVLDPGLLPRFLVWAAGLALIGAGTAWHLVRHRANTHGLFRHPLFLFGLLYVLATSAGFLVAINMNDWLFATLRTALMILHLVLFALILLWNRDRWMHLAVAVSIIGAGIAALGLLQWAGGLFVFSHSMETPFGTMMHQNLFASWLFLTVPLTGYGFLRTRAAGKLWFGVALLFILAAIVASTTRSVWAALTLGLALAGLVYVITDKKLSIETIGRTGIQKRIAALLVFVILLSGSLVFIYKVSDQFDDIEERTILWRKTGGLALKNPAIGLGAGNWVAHTNIENMRSQITKKNWIRPHNDPLWVLSETGFPGFIGYAGLYLTALWLLVLVIRRSTSKERKTLAVMILFALIGFGLNSMSSFPRERIEHTAFATMYVALAFALYRVQSPLSDGRRSRNLLSAGGLGLGVLVALFSIVVGVYRFEGESHIRKAHVLMSNKIWRQALHEVDKAYTPFYSNHANGLSLDYMRGICNYELKRYREAIQDFERSRDTNPKQIMNTWYIGRAQLHLGQYERSVYSFEECLRWWPNNKFTLPGLALAEYRLGRYEDAFRHLLRFRKIIHEDRQATSYDDLWQALNKQVGPERAKELTEEDTWEPKRMRHWRQKR